MTTKLTRKIVRIDEDKCDGCGQCAPKCAEGALRIINGKAKLLAENLCDGLGACLGECPRGAIAIEERPAEEFDEAAVHKHLHAPVAARTVMAQAAHAGGCPGSRLRVLGGGPAARADRNVCPIDAAADKNVCSTDAADKNVCSTDGSNRPSRLGQWPVQLALVPPAGPIWQDADVLIAADCVPFAYPDFHEKMLAGKTLAIACPKLDDVRPYVQKLAMIFANNAIRSITVAHMEVPCCGGIVRAVQMALAQTGKDIPMRDVTVGVDGVVR